MCMLLLKILRNGRRNSRRNGFPAFAFAAFVSVLFSEGSQSARAQVVDIAEQAQAVREELATEIAAVDGDLLRSKLLKSADNERLTHWYSGEVQFGEQWLTLEQAEQQAANNKHLTAYRELREKSTGRLAEHERLARWCNKHALTDLANMHWLYVLRIDHDHRAALNELGLTWHQGILLTHAEAKSYQEREREWVKQKKAWQTKVKRLRRDIEKGLVKEEIAARQELREIREPAAVPALLELFEEAAGTEEKTIARRTELMAVLGGIDAPAAIETLLQAAVESEDEPIRYAALDQLKAKPYHEYVPQLLSELQMPIEASVSINQIGHQVVNHYAYAQETPYGEQERSYQSCRTIPGQRYSAINLHRYGKKKVTTYTPARHRAAFDCNGHRVPAVSTPASSVTRNVSTKSYAGTVYLDHPEYQANRGRTLYRSRAQAAHVGDRNARRNNVLLEQNERITNVLTEVTSETLSAFPKSWWNWWGDYLNEHPGMATVGARQQLNRALLNQESRGLARGTWIWTRRGQVAVEDVLPGDYVLAQDPRTGELAYKVVLTVATPRQMTVNKVELSETELHCAPGHVVWVAGTGWQRISKLTPGQSLHGATTSSQVSQVDAAFEIDSYDLVVEGFHTFFVGKQGLLVHDATPIGSAHVALPGFSPAAVAEAVKVASNAR